jgi:hypothetical protein
MGQKFSNVAGKVLSGVSAVAKAVPSVVQGALEGSAVGSTVAPGIGTVLGGIGGGLTKAVSHISDVVDAVKGNSQDVPLKPEHLANALTDGYHAVQSASQLKHLLPQQHQDKLDAAIQSAANGKIAQGLVQTGKFANATAKGVLANVYKGKVAPDAAEHMFSPTMEHAKTLISPMQQKELKDQRSVAYMANLNPVQPQPIPVEA